jgi:single-stranded-DNA-specific exonuclease
MNSERQQIEITVREAAEQQIAGDERILILAGDGWHKGVLGLSAGRIAQSHHRPTLVMTIDGDRCVGSGRSITTINLHEQLDAVSDLFTHFGGHEFACGFSLPTANLPALRARLAERFAALDERLFARDANADGELRLGDIDREFLAAHEMLQPFGAGNPQPLFVANGLDVISTRDFATDCCELVVSDGDARANAVVWPSVRRAVGTIAAGAAIDLLFHVEPDSYSPSGVRLSVVDARNSTRI